MATQRTRALPVGRFFPQAFPLEKQNPEITVLRMGSSDYAIQELEFGYAIYKHGIRIATFEDKALAERYLATVSSAELKKVETPDDRADTRPHAAPTNADRLQDNR